MVEEEEKKKKEHSSGLAFWWKQNDGVEYVFVLLREIIQKTCVQGI